MTVVRGIEAVTLRAGEWLLRPPRLEERDDALTMLRDPDVALWNPVGDEPDLAAAEGWLVRGADWSGGDHATFSVVTATDGRLAGNVSLHRIDREQAVAWMGYRVAPWARGRGVATLGVSTVTDWSFAALGLARVELCHAVDNPASCRVAVKSGYLLEGTLRQANVYGDGRRHDEHVHGRLATDVLPPAGSG